MSAVASPVAHAGQPFLLPNSLVISSTTYDRTHGAIAALTVGTSLPGSATAKWSLVAGTWQLDYVLTKGLIGVVDGNLKGYDGPYPAVTTIGLRNLAGVVNDEGTVTLWAATATSSASGDNGADPNKVVRITDRLSATTMAGQVARESFTTIAGPNYGTAYRGVAYVCAAIDPRTGVCHSGVF